MKKFDFCIGNPPYQDETENKGDRSDPLFDKFMDGAYEVSKRVELISPARFLFNGGQTSKAWNKKMLSDDHLKVLYYENNGKRIFPNTDIKGGVAITYRDQDKNFGAIGTFTRFDELNSIMRKVFLPEMNTKPIGAIIASQGLYKFSDAFFQDYPGAAKDVIGKGTRNKIVSSVIEKLPKVFLDNKPENGEYIKFLGRINTKRIYKYIKREYLVDTPYIDTYNLFIPEANNSGHFGETLTEPEIGFPGEASADTFLSAGQFDNKEEVENLLKYYRTKFFRAMLGIKKVTQHSPAEVWKYVPNQDFSDSSDIHWSLPVHEIDCQLYKKYGLSENEITFIETHVEEMG